MATACSNYSPALHEGRASCECRRGFFNVYVVGTNERCGLGVPNGRVGGGLMWPFFRPLCKIAQTHFLREDKSAFLQKGLSPRDGNRGAGHVAR